MLDEETYEICKPFLEDNKLEDEEKTEKLEEVLRKETSLRGDSLENAILDALWRHRNNSKADGSDAPSRHKIIRKSSPAPWQINRVPTPVGSLPAGASPSITSGIPVSRPSFSRQKSSAPSPFASPRPSPRLAFAQSIPHSPNLNAYEFSESSPTPEIYGDYGSDNVDWLVGDEVASNASSTGTGTLSAAAPEWQPQPDMSPYDILRSVLGDKKTNEEIEQALEKNAYDLGTTIAQLTGTDMSEVQPTPYHNDGSVLIGKAMTMEQLRPVTPGKEKSPVICKYWLAHGSCLRADCRFSHSTSTAICKYWMSGSCLAGGSCPFSHDPSMLMSNPNTNGNASVFGTPPQSFQLQEQFDQFPTLQPNQTVYKPSSLSFTPQSDGQLPTFTPMSQQRARGGQASRPHSRPNSRHQQRPEFQPSAPSVDDPDVFPSLAAMNAKKASKHHGHRPRHGHGNYEKETPSSLADLIRSSPSPSPAQRKVEAMKKSRNLGDSDSATPQRIPAPQHIPWLETGARANQQYLKYRQEAIKHGSIRNKFLQSAAQAWNRSDARAAKALSLRGQAENDAMRKAHREAARCLYEERNPQLTNTSTMNDLDNELYIDLHGLHPEESIEYLEQVLMKQERLGRRIIYAITGTGHHSKNGKDKVGKAVRNWLNEWGYTFREFSVPGERGGYIGGVLGIDVTSHRSHVDTGKEDSPVALIAGKIQLLKREDIGAS